MSTTILTPIEFVGSQHKIMRRVIQEFSPACDICKKPLPWYLDVGTATVALDYHLDQAHQAKRD